MTSLWIPILALIGLADASYLLFKKLKKEKVVCLIGDDCDRVVKSKYGFFFGIPNEAMGVAFYLLVLFLVLVSTWELKELLNFSLLLTTVAFLAFTASLYLLGIQAFVLKEWCEWCILSAAVNFLILFLTL